MRVRGTVNARDTGLLFHVREKSRSLKRVKERVYRRLGKNVSN